MRNPDAGPLVLKEMVEIPSLPVHVPILGTSTFCLSEKQKRAVTVGGGASRINRRRLPASEWLRRGLPVVCVRFPKPFQFLAHSAKDSNWRASLKYGRTIHDQDYALDAHQLKLNVVYIESFAGGE